MPTNLHNATVRPGESFSKADLANAGVKRISLATSLYTYAITAMHEAAKEIQDKGTFDYIDRTTTVDFKTILKD